MVASTNVKPNILLVIADDFGKDASPGFTEGQIKPSMAVLESLMASGVTYNNLWSAPLCTPTRSTILTGKYGINTGVLAVTNSISLNETSIQSYIDTETSNAYAHAIIGKWHLSQNATDPLDLGIGYYAGFLSGSISDYYSWPFSENGNANVTFNGYSTTKFTDLAIDWIDDQSKPWFLWLAYNAPHTPFHLAPDSLHKQGNLPTDANSIDANPSPYFMSAIEAMDTELGRLLASMSDEELNNTVIIFIGDNGTPGKVAQNPYRQRAKGSLYQGGINVPMIISGHGVSRSNATDDALINTSDLFATVASLAGVGVSEYENSYSFKGSLTNSNWQGKNYAYAEIEGTNSDGFTIRNHTYKLIVFNDGTEEFYNLSTDPYENNNLLLGNLNSIELDAKAELELEIANIRP